MVSFLNEGSYHFEPWLLRRCLESPLYLKQAKRVKEGEVDGEILGLHRLSTEIWVNIITVLNRTR